VRDVNGQPNRDLACVIARVRSLWQEPSMSNASYYVGLDVSVKLTQVCVCNQDFEIIAEAKVDTDPETIALYLYELNLPPFERVGLEAGPMSQWLYAGLAKAKLPIICIETRHARDFIKSQPQPTQQGWVCPKCGNVYSPRAFECSTCNGPRREIIR
jgi:hypothetical protein